MIAAIARENRASCCAPVRRKRSRPFARGCAIPITTTTADSSKCSWTERDPIESRSFVEVTHKTVDPDMEALEELRALRQLGTSREKLFELFGQNGLDRLERLERLDTLRRSNEAKVIDNVAPRLSKSPDRKRPRSCWKQPTR